MIKCADDPLDIQFDDLDQMRYFACFNAADMENAIQKYSSYLENAFNVLICETQIGAPNEAVDKIFEMICKAWAVPNLKLGYALCNTLRECGGLDFLIENCVSEDQVLQLSSAKLLEQCLILENREYVLEKGVEKVVHVVCEYKTQISSVEKSKVSTGILENLFKHSEIMCCNVIELGGLDVLLYECRNRDTTTLKHCASALANLSLYGGPESQHHMIKRNVPTWLFTLAVNTDVNIKYYAFLAIVVLVTNKEAEVAVERSKSLDLINPFVTTHSPTEFAKSNMKPSHSCGQSQKWLKRLVPVLSSTREEACNLAAFHFCMEAGIKKQLGMTSIFGAINAIEPLKKVTCCGNAIASRLAAKTLWLIGEEVPRQLSKEVPLWSVDDVHEWAKQNGFSEFAKYFSENLVDGDILLEITQNNLKYDIGMQNGIMIKRFMRELDNLKLSANYSSKDSTGLHSFLKTIGLEYIVYTYPMLNAGVNWNTISGLTEDQLENTCKITNSIHRSWILKSIESYKETGLMKPLLDKEITDVFISYRRSNGSELASLIKVYLALRGYRVFIDVVQLENGNFGHNLVKHLKKAKNFVLVLTQGSLDRCVGDKESNDWVHKEIVTAMQNQLNIIPVAVDDFTWPEMLPEDMRDLQKYNVVQWSYDYQDTCLDAIVTAIHTDTNAVLQDGTGSDKSSDLSTAVEKDPPFVAGSSTAPNIADLPFGDHLPPQAA